MTEPRLASGLVYCDASALVKLVRREAESAALSSFLRGMQSASSTLAHVEVLRAIGRSQDAPGGLARARKLLATVLFVPLSDDILDRAGLLTPLELRTLDAIHLASALSMASELDVVVAYDRRLARAARDFGLQVIAPGAEASIA